MYDPTKENVNNVELVEEKRKEYATKVIARVHIDSLRDKNNKLAYLNENKELYDAVFRTLYLEEIIEILTKYNTLLNDSLIEYIRVIKSEQLKEITEDIPKRTI